MTNEELKAFLEKMLATDTLSTETIALLMDATIHVALKLGTSLQGTAFVFDLMVQGHLPFEMVLQLNKAMGASEPQQFNKLEITGKEEVSEEEKQKLDNLLNGIDFDL